MRSKFRCLYRIPRFFGPLSFHGAFAKLRKATISSVMSVSQFFCLSVHPSVRMEQLGFH